MSHTSLTIELSTPEQTARVARRLAHGLKPGDTVLLSGPVGAGKSHFARNLIQALLIEPEDVPSPTFTLVQTYETTCGTLWHSDLYRINSTQDVEELGLIDAFQDAICLVEWPDRLGELTPDHALHVELGYGTDEDSRVLRATWKDTKWSNRMQDWPVS